MLMKHTLGLVVAMDRNRVIGSGGALPWHLPNDLGWFKRCTAGKPVVMGRRTHESIGRPLPDRPNIVLSSRADYTAPGTTVVCSVEDALAAAGPAEEVMVIGGGRLFAETIAFADRLYLTLVDAECPGDTWFPRTDAKEWREVFREHHGADERNRWPHSFLIWERVPD